MNVVELFEIPATIDPDRTVLTFGDRQVDATELGSRVAVCASWLAEYGLREGATIASIDLNVPAQPILFLAAARLGLTFATINPRVTPAERAQMLATLDPSAVFVGDALPDVAADVGSRTGLPVVAVDSWLDAPEPADGHPPHPPTRRGDAEPPALVLFTSGTVAAPKPFPFTHDGLSTYIAATVTLGEAEPDQATLLSVPLYHIAGVAGLFGALFAGRRVVLLPKFGAPEWLDAVERERVTHAFVVPTMLRRIVQAQRDAPRDLGSLTTLAYGAAPMPAATLEEAIEVLPSSVGFVNAFGQTETVSAVTVLGPDDHRIDLGDAATRELRRRRLRSVGRPLDGVALRIVADGADVRTGDVGEVWVSADWLRATDGQSNEVDAAGRPWRRTGDLGWLDEDGYLYLAGRQDDVIIKGGENISPAQVEAVLESHPDVVEACVVGVPDPEWGERLSASLIVRAAVDVERLAAFVRDRLGSLKTPAEYHVVGDLPRNAMGKVIRRAVRAELAAAVAHG